jgi:hypothetical protein
MFEKVSEQMSDFLDEDVLEGSILDDPWGGFYLFAEIGSTTLSRQELQMADQFRYPNPNEPSSNVGIDLKAYNTDRFRFSAFIESLTRHGVVRHNMIPDTMIPDEPPHVQSRAGFLLTALGFEFVRACRPPKKNEGSTSTTPT